MPESMKMDQWRVLILLLPGMPAGGHRKVCLIGGIILDLGHVACRPCFGEELV
jgi:hypothetical protein